MILHVVVIGVVGGGGRWVSYRSVKWNMKTIESQRSRLGYYWTFLVLTAFQIEDNRHWPALRGLSSLPSTNTREPWPSDGAKAPLEAYTGSKKSCHRNQTRDFGARHTVKCDSVLSQQSISGEIVSLILCVWKPGFFQIPSHIYFVTSRHHRWGIAKLKNVFRSFLTHFKKLLRNFKHFLFSRIFYWLTDWLTHSLPYWCLQTSIMASSLFNVTSSGGMPFCQPQQLQCLHHDSTNAHLCSPLYSIPFSLTA